MARRSPQIDIDADLNLAPIMNMVMILIPLLLVMVEFDHVAISPIEATSSGGSSSGSADDTEEGVRPPRLIVSISSDGFRIADFFGSADFLPFAEPIGRCKGVGSDSEATPPTVCLEPDKTPEKGEYVGLDYAGLYNRLVQIRLHEPWKKAYERPENSVLLLTADPDVPAATLVRTMDLGRYFLNPNGSGKLENPLEGPVNVADYLLGGTPDNAQREDLLRADFLISDDSPGLNRDKEGRPNNIIDMFPTVSLVAPR